MSQVVKLVDDAQKPKSHTQSLAGTAAKWLAVIAIISGITTFFYWYLTGQSLAFAMERMVAVIVICCPHALRLAVPLVAARSTAFSVKNGEQASEHPIATGIINKAKALSINIPLALAVKTLPGIGIEATVQNRHTLAVSPGYLKEKNIDLPAGFVANDNETIVFIIIDNELFAYIALSDQLRPEATSAVAALKQNNIQSILLTGDNEKVARSVSVTLGMKSFIAEVLPHQKLEKIKELQSNGEYVTMAGDGVNNTPALAQADIGIAVSSRSDIAAATAGIILVNNNPKDVARLILFGKATYRKMIQNLIWATGYNLVALPVAAGIFYKQRILLSPAIGAVLMTVSTIVVAINAGMLNVKKI